METPQREARAGSWGPLPTVLLRYRPPNQESLWQIAGPFGIPWVLPCLEMFILLMVVTVKLKGF